MLSRAMLSRAMLSRRSFYLGGTMIAGGAIAMNWLGTPSHASSGAAFEILRTDEEWRRLLTREQYQVLRKHGTERAGSSPLDREKRTGVFACAGCALPLYDSATKFDSGTGWPSFWQAMDQAVGTSTDSSFFMKRTEVHCRRCGGHLGHIFDDGPKPTGKRHCINGVALSFVPGDATPKSS